MKRTFILRNNDIRRNCWEYIKTCPDDYKVTIAPMTRSSGQNEKFHALCGDLEKSNILFCGKKRNLEDWKAILVSGHAKATKMENELVVGIEGEIVAMRESTASMSVARSSSLIEYTMAYCQINGVKNNG